MDWTMPGNTPLCYDCLCSKNRKGGVTPSLVWAPKFHQSNFCVCTFGKIMLIALKGQTLKHLLQPVHSSTFAICAVLIQFSTSRVIRWGLHAPTHLPQPVHLVASMLGSLWRGSIWNSTGECVIPYEAKHDRFSERLLLKGTIWCLRLFDDL